VSTITGLDYLLRPAADLSDVLPLMRPDAASTLSADIFLERLARAEYRAEWTWTASDGGSGVLAVVVWWGSGSAEGSAPDALDGIYVHESVARADRAGLAAALIAAGQAQFAVQYGLTTPPPEYHVFLPCGWRTDPSVTAALGWRMDAVTRAGLTSLLERLRFEWRSPARVPARSGRLSFRVEPDDEVFVSLFARVLTGSLDASTTAAALASGAQEAAREDVAFYRDRMLGERAWWRLAVDAAGSAVGFGIPSRNPAFPVVGYLGVVPEHRGHGYADDILAEITRILADEAGAEVIRADTDLANTPMAASLERVGYRNFSRRLVFSAPLPLRPLTTGLPLRWAHPSRRTPLTAWRPHPTATSLYARSSLYARPSLQSDKSGIKATDWHTKTVSHTKPCPKCGSLGVVPGVVIWAGQAVLGCGGVLGGRIARLRR